MKNNFLKIHIFLSAVFFILSAIFLFFLFTTTNANKEKTQITEQQWQAENSRRDKIKTLDSFIQATKNERAQLETHFAYSSNIVPFLNTVDRLGSDAGVKVEISSVDVSKDYNGLFIQIKASGSFDSLYRFLMLLENSPYELELVSLELGREASLEANNANIKNPKWNASFRVKLLSFVK